MSFHTKYFGPLEALFAEGIETGVFRTDIDPGIAVVGLIGPISMHLRGAIEGLPLPEDYAVRIVDIYLNGVSPQ
jgi:hypothetical protein